MSPVYVRAVGRHRRPTPSRLPDVPAAATAALSGTLALTGASTAGAHDAVRAGASSAPTLRYDSAGDAVRALQKRLGVPATGWFGPDTRRAVRRFETENGLVVNGVVGRRTWAHLSGETPAPQGDVVASRPKSRPDAEARAKENRPDSDRASRGEERRSLADRLFAEAAKHVGKPYSYGATGPGSFDCSGFTGYVFRQVGINLPRSSQDQRNAVPRVSAEDARPGDLMFSHDSSGRVFHVAIYAGDGKIWDSPRPGETVGK